MPTYSGEIRKADTLVNWYEQSPFTKYCIYRGNSEKGVLRETYLEADKETGLERLQNFISSIEPENNNTYFLKLLPSGKGKAAEAPGVTFCFYQAPARDINGFTGNQYHLINELLSEVRALKQKVEEQELDEDEDEEPGLGSSPANYLQGILENPAIQGKIAEVLGNAIGGMFGGKPVQAVAGIEQDDIGRSVEILMSKGVTAADLAKLAAMEKKQIDFLLSMLRK